MTCAELGCSCQGTVQEPLTEEDLRRILREELMNHRFRVLAEEDLDNPELEMEC